MKKLNIAVVGAGIYGKNHLDAYTSNPNVNLVAVCDLKKEITDKVEQDYQVKTYNDMEEMLKSEEIDAVSVATPDPYHKDPVMTAIRYGKDVLVENHWQLLLQMPMTSSRQRKKPVSVLWWITTSAGIRHP